MLKRFTPILALTAACWLMFGLNNILWHGLLTDHGIIPRHLSGLAGIIWAPFLHGSLSHLIANTGPLLILGGILCLRGREEFALATTVGIIAGGALTWLVARNAVHVGASGLIFCYFGYLVSLAIFNRSVGTILLAVACIIAYGGIIRGVLPGVAGISWESHAAGFAAGIMAAWLSSKLNRHVPEVSATKSLDERPVVPVDKV